MIAIVDYGMGNLRSVQKGFERVGVTAAITDDADMLVDADAIVLPGVGAFSAAMQRLKEANLIDAIRQAIDAGKPYLGICLGLQLLFTESEEGGRHAGAPRLRRDKLRHPENRGLNIIPGKVVRFPRGLKVPHIGWNEIDIQKDIPLLKDIPQKSYLYFVHSYYVVPDDPSVIATTTNYGIDFTSIICKDNIFAIQCHPEKSQTLGLRILENFGQLTTFGGVP